VNTITVVFLIYFAIVNLLAFALFGIDKRMAKKNKDRVSEGKLFLLAILGGALGAWGGMYFFRHKTKHWYFVVFIPLILFVQIGVVVYLLFIR